MAVVRQEKNIMTRHPMLILMFAFVLRASSFAAENPAAKHLAPFADDQTVAILDLDVDRLDVDALKQKAEELSAKLAPEEQSAPLPEAKKPAPAPAADQRAQKRREAEERQRQSAARKPLESRLKRIDEQMAKLSAQKAAIDAQLADPGVYGEGRKETLKTLILDQAYVARELAQLEAEWLELQHKLEQLVA